MATSRRSASTSCPPPAAWEPPPDDGALLDALARGDLFAAAAALDCDAVLFDAAGMPRSARLARTLAERTFVRAMRAEMRTGKTARNA